ncbi:hypothetical protein K443DRAFT_313725 [Laccaria amethystina LaAM-08-1]|uniref:Uncharacterized protein n=1 Tax=Laccaria amethystina LaAM-08-1 TaxID=1095629 RepID=A0A0C9WUH0_9AGAR|nr:hypothetical protein K443DRAFT_313725 [Laccaria amethystina LaAM-08-1]
MFDFKKVGLDREIGFKMDSSCHRFLTKPYRRPEFPHMVRCRPVFEGFRRLGPPARQMMRGFAVITMK